MPTLRGLRSAQEDCSLPRMEAAAHFGASVFWAKRSGALGGEQAMIEYWQVRRAGG